MIEYRRLPWVLSLLCFALPLDAQGPSFSCAHATSQVNKLICGSSELSALDRQLNNVFNNMREQPLDQQKFTADENTWLAKLMRDCTGETCVATRYKARISELREQSLKVASPAAYAETRPFPAHADSITMAQGFVGKICSYQPNVVGPVIPGFASVPHFLPIVAADGMVVVRQRLATKFAFLVFSPTGESACQIRDFVALPADTQSDSFLQCSVTDPDMNGFGVRSTKTHALEAFWNLTADGTRIERVAVGVLGIEKRSAVTSPKPENEVALTPYFTKRHLTRV